MAMSPARSRGRVSACTPATKWWHPACGAACLLMPRPPSWQKRTSSYCTHRVHVRFELDILRLPGVPFPPSSMVAGVPFPPCQCDSVAADSAVAKASTVSKASRTRSKASRSQLDGSLAVPSSSWTSSYRWCLCAPLLLDEHLCRGAAQGIKSSWLAPRWRRTTL